MLWQYFFDIVQFMKETGEQIITGPENRILTVLKGQISEPTTTISYKPATSGQEVTVRLVQEGSGMAGLEAWEDNKEWGGLFNHIFKTDRVATFLGQELQRQGEDVDPRLILNPITVSHSGRRLYDEATWYPDVVADAAVKVVEKDQRITEELLAGANLPKSVIEVVRAHGFVLFYPIDTVDSWEKKVSLYADFRVSQNVMSLGARFEDYQRAVAAGRVTQEQYDQQRVYIEQVEQEIFSILPFKPEDITEEYPPQPRWECYIRRLYINDAEQGIFSRLSELQKENAAGSIDAAQLEKEFPPDTWWGSYAHELYSVRNGQPFQPREGRELGIARAIEFYSWLETTNLGGKAENLPRPLIK